MKCLSLAVLYIYINVTYTITTVTITPDMFFMVFSCYIYIFLPFNLLTLIIKYTLQEEMA